MPIPSDQSAGHAPSAPEVRFPIKIGHVIVTITRDDPANPISLAMIDASRSRMLMNAAEAEAIAGALLAAAKKVST